MLRVTEDRFLDNGRILVSARGLAWIEVDIFGIHFLTSLDWVDMKGGASYAEICLIYIGYTVIRLVFIEYVEICVVFIIYA